MPRIELQSLTRIYPTHGGLHPLTLTIESGESFAVIGPSGSGKTTLLRLIAGLERPDSGSLFFDSRPMLPIPPHHRDLAYVTQRPALYPHLDGFENLAFGLRRTSRLAESEIQFRVQDTAERLHVTHLLKRHPSGLSAGEQQRIALGRLLIRRASLWLLDEPFANLDSELRDILVRELNLLQREFRATMILVTHDPGEAMTFGQRLAVLDKGHLVQVGSPTELMTRPGNRFVAYCLSRPSINLIAGRLQTRPNGATYYRSDVGAMEVALSRIDTTIMSATITLGLRAETIRLGIAIESGEVSLGEWVVGKSERWGRGWLVTLRRDSLELRTVIDREIATDSRHHCFAHSRDLLFFDGVTERVSPLIADP